MILPRPHALRSLFLRPKPMIVVLLSLVCSLSSVPGDLSTKWIQALSIAPGRSASLPGRPSLSRRRCRQLQPSNPFDDGPSQLDCVPPRSYTRVACLLALWGQSGKWKGRPRGDGPLSSYVLLRTSCRASPPGSHLSDASGAALTAGLRPAGAPPGQHAQSAKGHQRHRRRLGNR